MAVNVINCAPPDSPPWSGGHGMQPKGEKALEDCYFYHSLDIPGYGYVKGSWDLRGREDDYLGHMNIQGKSVLEFGPASGGLTFYMERMGADVTGYELSPSGFWDKAFPQNQTEEARAGHSNHIRQLNNGFWFAHKAFQSKSKVVYGDIYKIPEDIGMFDVSLFGSILLHLRDPFLALQMGAKHTNNSIIVTDCVATMSIKYYIAGKLMGLMGRATGLHCPVFIPNRKHPEYDGTWWQLTPGLIAEMLKILGFPYTRVTYHMQRHEHTWMKYPLFTVTAERESR